MLRQRPEDGNRMFEDTPLFDLEPVPVPVASPLVDTPRTRKVTKYRCGWCQNGSCFRCRGQVQQASTHVRNGAKVEIPEVICACTHQQIAG